MTIDIFITCSQYHYKTLPAAIWSALTQTYQDIRLVLYMDGTTDSTDKLLSQWLPDALSSPSQCLVTIKPGGSSGNAGVGRDWYFNFAEKSDWVKFLDADDTLTPKTIEIMARYIKDDVDAVFCPIQHISSNRYYQKISGKPQKGHAGAGSMMLSRCMVNDLVDRKFSWQQVRGDDEKFLEFIGDDYKIQVANEDFLYIYYK